MFEIFFFCDAKNNCAVLDALGKLAPEVEAKARVRIERLAELGNKLKRPEGDFLRDGIYELRFRHVKVQYRILYFFSTKGIIILSSLITKENKVPPKEIDKCIENKKLIEGNFKLHTYSSKKS